MAKKKTSRYADPTKEQSVMKNLSQIAAANLIGMTPRSLRDSSAPRNENDRYDSAQLVEWSKLRIGSTALDDYETERLLVIIDSIKPTGIGTTVDTLRELQAKHGGTALQRFTELILEEWGEEVDEDPEDCAPATPEKIKKLINDQIIHSRKYHEETAATDAHKVSVVCEGCDKVRRGRQWIKGDVPAGFVFTYGTCPECEN